MTQKRNRSAMSDEWWEAMVISYQKTGGDLWGLKNGLVKVFIGWAVQRGMEPDFAGTCIGRIQRGQIGDASYIRIAYRAFISAGGDQKWLSHESYMPSLAAFYAMDFDPDLAGRELAGILADAPEIITNGRN